MEGLANKIADLKKRGGGISAPLFFALVLIASAAAFYAVRVPAGREDSLLAFAPKDSVIYAHAMREDSYRILAVIGKSSGSLRPDETAVFAIKSKDVFTWSAAASWNNGRSPDTQEAGALAADDWKQVSPGVFVNGDTAAGEAGSLLADKVVTKALTAARGAALVQVFFKPADLNLPEAEGFRPDHDLIAGVRFEGAKTSAFIMPVENAASAGPLGIRVPRQDKKTDGFLVADSATLSLGLEKPDFNVFDLFFPDLAGNKVKNAGSDAESTLRELMQGPVGVSIFGNVGGSTGPVGLHMPGVDPDRIKSGIEKFAPYAWPTRKSLRLPDNSSAIELRSDSGIFESIGGVPPIFKLKTGADKTLFVSTDGANGTVIADDIGAIKKIIGEKSPETCPVSGKSAIRVSTLKFSNLPVFELFSGFKSYTLSQIGDNLMFFCGYNGENVDNLK